MAFAVPRVAAIAVGTSNLSHLDQLCDAADLRPDPDTVVRYRALLEERSTLAQKETANVGEAART